ncbi:MAG: DUF3488 and transglutaminase-like domain-containing protein [Myxococcaceae bacterium]|nr:DUF3488 and transglutaminase-like domain-containing protein [Myxococcaceae bacterium]MCI0670020.1 DUF3488 and transglutaminase-like domain-containing protein [Myxococcaceae bacterium]
MQPRSLLRLRLRDLAAAFAFVSMAVSGQLPAPALVVVGLGVGLALLGRRPFGSRGGLSALVLALMGALLMGAVARGMVDLVVAACTFAGLVTTQRLLSAPTPATDAQVHLTGLLMVAGGAALSGELLYALALALFATFAALSLGLGVVEAATPAGEVVPVRAVLRLLALGLLFALVGSLAFFVLFPRLSWNVAGRRVSPGLGPATTGYSDTVRLGGTGTLKTNPRVVLRARLTPDPGLERLDAYWVGSTFDTFDGTEWSSVGEPLGSADQVRLAPGGEGVLHQEVELLPAYGATTAVALESPSLIGGATAHSPQGSRRTGLVRSPSGEVRFAVRGTGYSYHAYSMPPARQETRAARVKDASLFLSLPPDMDPRVSALAARELGTTTEPLASAERLATYLRSNYRYSLELPGEVEDPLAHFLFERQEGHCEHFATALAILLRTQGIPARVAAGFFGGERMEGHYVVRAGDAHAWTQVLVPGRGWVTVDATPEAYRAAQPAALLAWLTRVYEAVDALWRTQVLDYSFRDQVDLLRSLVRPPTSREAMPEGRLRLPPARAWAAALAVALAVYATLRLLDHRRRRTAPHAATGLLEAVERELRRTPGVWREGEPLEELAARLRVSVHPLAAPVARVTRRYLEARFGGVSLADGEARALARVLARAIEARRQADAPRSVTTGR